MSGLSNDINLCVKFIPSNLTLLLLINEGIDLILVIQTFYPSARSVLYNKDVFPTSSIV